MHTGCARYAIWKQHNRAISETEIASAFLPKDPTVATYNQVFQSRRRRVGLGTTEELIIYGIGLGAAVAAVQSMQANAKNLRR